jgi:putative ABC transport system ATP-binding protein
MKKMIELRSVSKVYGEKNSEVHALKSFSATFQHGEFVVIMGPSGCGKSTLLHIVGLLDSLTEGMYLLNGQDTSSMNIKQKAVLRNDFFGFVFQSFNLIEEMTALQNVYLPLKYSSIPKNKYKSKGYKVMESVGVKDLSDKMPNELSGGEQQRVAIARALVNNPDVILADEPTGNLDSTTGQEIVKLLKELCKKEKKTVIVVTHDPRVAAFADHIIQMCDGRILETTKLEDTCDNISDILGFSGEVI